MSNQAASEAFYAALLEDDPIELYERAPCGYLTTTPDGTVVKVNDTFCSLTGYEKEELVGRCRFPDLLTAGGRIYHQTHYASMLNRHGTVREVALELVRADEDLLPVLVNAILEKGPDGEPKLVRVVLFDATHRRAYERELLLAKQQAERSEAHARALARTLQSTLIPPSPPDLPGLDVSAAYRPSGSGEEVGGDFYDIFQIKTGDWVVALGDVCGKGVDAAVVTSLVRHTLRALTVQEDDPSAVLHSLNEVLLRHGTDRFCTVVLVRLRRAEEGWAVTMSCAGHPLPLYLSDHGDVQPVGEPGSLVGVLPSVVFHDTELRLTPGDLLVMYTDGVTEGRRRGSDFYGDQRLAQAVRTYRDTQMPAEEILADVLDFQEGSARDDIAVVAVRAPSPHAGPDEPDEPLEKL